MDWGRTRAWSSGGYYARGREPEGAIAAEDYESVREELAARLTATTDPGGRPLGTRVFKPQEIYARVEGVAPDLIVHFGDLAWRAIGGVGYGRVHVQENDTGPDDCNHALHGAFVLAGPGVPELGELRGVRLLDIAPTLLEACGHDVPDGMQGHSLLSSAGGGPSPAVEWTLNLDPFRKITYICRYRLLWHIYVSYRCPSVAHVQNLATAAVTRPARPEEARARHP